MRKGNIYRILLVGALAVLICVWVTSRYGSTGSEKEIRAEIWIEPTCKMDAPLKIHWRIRNNSSVPLCVYSTFLHINHYVGIRINPDSHTLEVRFTNLKQSNYVPAYFPSGDLMEIDPGSSIQDVFTTDGAIKDLRDVSNVVSPSGLTEEQAERLGTRLVAGAWKIQALFGYGIGDFDSVKKEIESDRKNDENPMNAIIRWQKLVATNSVEVRFTE